ncbi:MAG: hypothetical protein HOQ22_05595 [Nocardioidaceae bacterium]|nr:hypothetical protein [Nocardioidaceae bacterium]NUS50501.1 hypothetical protein [Nocardioidaceae bacterium]
MLTASFVRARRLFEAGADAMAIRRARDGKLVTRFVGHQNVATGTFWSPIWEDRNAFVVRASRRNVRCTIHGPCEQVDERGIPAPSFLSFQERRYPPS